MAPLPMGVRPLAGALVIAALAGGVVACTPDTPPQIALATPPKPGTCAEWVGQPVERTCIPRMARAGKPLELEIEERCGVCGATAERCSVTVEGHVLTFSLDGKTCEPPAGVACREECGKNRVRCKVPALEEGRYEVHYGDTSRHVDTFDVVTRGDAMTACALDDGSVSATSVTSQTLGP